MKKLIVITILLIIPYKVFAVSAIDIFSQQNISGTYVESGYADIKLNKNAKNVVMDILYHQIINYIFDNMDSETAKYVSIYMPANLQECDDEYLSYIEQEISLNYSSDVLSICREDVYTKNLEYMFKETAEVEKGAYYIILENMFKNHTQEILQMKKFSMDKFINILAVNKLISFDGRLFIDDNMGLSVEEIQCENNHTPVTILNPVTKMQVDNITINKRDFFIKGCLVKNKHNYFKYVTMYEKTDAGYNMYMRMPLFTHTYKRNKPNQNSNILFADVNRLHFNIYEPLSDNMSLQYDYMVYRKGTYLQGLSIKHKDKTEIIYSDLSENKFVLTEQNISLKLFKDMVNNYCKNGSNICRILKMEEVIDIMQ